MTKHQKLLLEGMTKYCRENNIPMTTLSGGKLSKEQEESQQEIIKRANDFIEHMEYIRCGGKPNYVQHIIQIRFEEKKKSWWEKLMGM